MTRTQICFKPAWHFLSESKSMAVIIFLLLAIAPGSNAQIRITKKYEKKANKSIVEVFGDSLSHDREIESIDDDYHACYEIYSGDSVVGSKVFATAKGRYDYFDYLLLLDSEHSVKAIKILRYRSDHGYQIASGKWLESFYGYDGESRLEPGKDIDAISGATISASSLCNDLYLTINMLRMLQEEETAGYKNK